mgnify:CR=1 FL=1
MINDWKKYESVNKRLEHRLTITKSGYIGFPNKFYEDNRVDNYKYIAIYYSPSESAVGIRFSNDEQEKGVIKIHHYKDSKGGWVSAKNFFKTNGIDFQSFAGRYEWNKENPEGIGELFVLKLKLKEVASEAAG